MDIRTLAERAGTSTASVSFVLNDKWHKRVRPDLAAKIKRLAERYNYSPNAAGRGLALGRHLRIALCVEGWLTDYPVWGTCSFYEILSTVSARLNAHGYALDILQITPSFRNIVTRKNALVRHNDAAILIAPRSPSLRRVLHELNLSIPHIVVDANLNDAKYSYVFTNMRESAQRAVSYFLRRGHTRIAVVRGEFLARRFSEKLKGVRKALSEFGLSLDPDLIFEDMRLPLFERGYSAGRQLLSIRPRPTAFFCTDNGGAVGLLACLKEQGIDVPGDVEVIGFGDTAMAELTAQGLSYVKRPIRQIADICVDQLIRWLEYKEPFRPCQIECKEELILQRTTAERPADHAKQRNVS